jgi:peptide/nickel transport system ATP-binding protein
MEYRQLVESHSIDIENLVGPDSEYEGGDGVKTISRPEIKHLLWTELFDEQLTGDTGSTIEKSFDHIIEGEWSEAEEVLRNEFESVCERNDPELRGRGHESACHLIN